MRPVRAFVIFFLFLRPVCFRSGAAVGLLAALSLQASAEVIHLKNGRTIWAEHVSETATRVEYTVGDDSYAITKSSVSSIEAGGIAPEKSSGRHGEAGALDVTALIPAGSANQYSALAGKIIHKGIVDEDALLALEQQGNPAATVAGYYMAGKNEFEKGDFAKAKRHFEAGLRLEPGNLATLNYYAALLIRTGNVDQALPYAERAAHLAPDSPEALNMLGYAQFAADHDREAIQAWKHSLEVRADPVIQNYLAKVERASNAETNYVQRESSHFTLRYEGKQTSESLRSELMSTLDAEYDDLVRVLGVAPRHSIAVVLYTSQQFFDVTQAPSWSGAVNDGKLRIPIEGITTMTPELARVLRHELAHSFINQLSGGRCPQWLNEGIAQAIEPKSISSRGRRLALLFEAQREIPFNTLEGSFMRLSPAEANLAYDESLAAVQYINEIYGMSDLQRVLSRLGEGSSPEAALRTTIHSDYGQLQEELGKYLIGKYLN